MPSTGLARRAWRAALLLAAPLSIVVLGGCGSDDTFACLHRLSSGGHFCLESSSDYCESSTGGQTELVPDTTCASLGYETKCSGAWRADPTCESFPAGDRVASGGSSSGGSSSGGSSSGGSSSGGSGDDCENAWTCAEDGQATPLCGAACTYSGSQRTQTCEVLGQLSSKAKSCCSVC